MLSRYVVYTVIVGGFDNVKQPIVTDPRFDYILFTDLPIDSEFGVWQVRSIGYESDDLRKKSRFPKIRPEISLPEYKASLYIDGNIGIISQCVYNRCVELAEKGVEWAGIKHQSRDCVYDEMNAIVGLGWVHDYEVLDWYRFLRNEKYPEHNGMFENNIIFRTHTQTVRRINELWWWTLEEKKVKRDQFSLMYAMWQVPEMKTVYFLLENENAWNNDGWFVCESHNSHKKVLKKSLWEKLRDRYIRMYYWDGGWEVYYTRWFDKLLKYPFPHVVMHLWTAWILVRYDLKFLTGRVWMRITRKENPEIL